MKNTKQNATNSSGDLMANNSVKNQVQSIKNFDNKETNDIIYLLNSLEHDLVSSQSGLYQKPLKYKEYANHLYLVKLLQQAISKSIRLPYLHIQNQISKEYAKDTSLTGAIINLNWSKETTKDLSRKIIINVNLWK